MGGGAIVCVDYMPRYFSNILQRLGICAHDTVGPFWERDAVFMQLYAQVRPHTLVSVDRCYMLYQLAKFTNHVDGDLATLGVYLGGVSKLLSEVTQAHKKYFLFDTFTGMPTDHATQNERESLSKTGDFSNISLATIKKYLSNERFIFKQGFFPDSAKGLEQNRFSFVYLDADLYQSTKDGLEFFYPRLTDGGIIVLDDYGSRYWDGVTQAVDEFTEKYNITPIVSTRSQCVIMKCRAA